MHAPLKGKPRRRVEPEEDPDSSDDDGLELAGDAAKKPMQILMEDAEAAGDPAAAEDGDEDAPMDQLEVNFEFQEPQETDYHSLKQFSQTLLHGTKFDHAGLADYVLALSKARHIGTVLKVKESLDGETFGFISVIAVGKTRHLEFVKQIINYLVTKATQQNPDQGARLRQLFEDPTPVGIILSTRMLNVPPEIGMHLHQTLMQECEQAADHDKSYAFQNFVLLSGFYEEVKEKGAQKKKASRSDGVNVYFREEEQMYAKAAALSFTFPVMHNDRTTRWSFAGTVRETAQVLVVPRDRIASVLRNIEELMK